MHVCVCRYAEYRSITVRIYSPMDTEELHQVEALFGLHPLLLKDGKDTLQSKVEFFRELLYKLAKEDVTKEPPKSSVQWRRLCAASVGKPSDRAVGGDFCFACGINLLEL